MSQQGACPLCTGNAAPCYSGCLDLEYFIEREADFCRCQSCGLIFMDPLPAVSELAGLYPATYHNFSKPENKLSAFLLNRFHDHHAAICAQYLPAGGSLLEVGAAGGDLLERLRERGYPNVQGIELSAEGCEIARSKGLNVYHGAVETFSTEERFDVIFMSHVIEHVVDPVATVERLVSFLNPGGVLYLETPNVASLDGRIWGRHWGLVHFPRHLYLFDRSTLRRLVEDAGLRVDAEKWEINSCGWALSIQGALRRLGLDSSRRARSFYYPLLLLACLPLNLVDMLAGGTAFMATVARKVPATS